MNAELGLRELSLELLEIPKPVAKHVRAKQVDKLPANECPYCLAVGERSLDAATALERGAWEAFGAVPSQAKSWLHDH